MTSAFRDRIREPGYRPVRARCIRQWAARTAASTVRSEEKGSFSVVGMFCSSTEGERISTSSRGFALGSSAGTKPCLSSRSSVSSDAVACHTA